MFIFMSLLNALMLIKILYLQTWGKVGDLMIFFVM